MTNQQKIEKVCEWLQEAAQEHAELCGGYPDIVEVVEHSIVVAGEDDTNGPTLAVYPRDYVLDWYREIRQCMKDYPEEDRSFHVNESRPPDGPLTYSA